MLLRTQPDPLVTVAFTVALLLALFLLAENWRVGRRQRHYERLYHTERARSVWADAREQLLQLAVDGKISPKSSTFGILYRIQTFVLRRPDAYHDIARELLDGIQAAADANARAAPMPRSMTATALHSERATLPPELGGVLGQMAKGAGLLAPGSPGSRPLLRPLMVHGPRWMGRFATWGARRFGRWCAARWPAFAAGRALQAAATQLEALARRAA